MKKAVSLTINTIVLIVLAVSVFIIAAIMLFSASKGSSTILSAGQFYVKDSLALDRARKDCKMLCEWAKSSGDFLDSKYCNYQVSLKVVNPSTGKEEERLFYCWQKPIDVYCENINEYAGQYIIYDFVDLKENKCKEVKIDSFKFVEIADSIAKDIALKSVKYAFPKDVLNDNDFVEWLYYEGYLNLKIDENPGQIQTTKYVICKGDKSNTINIENKDKLSQQILTVCKDNTGNPVTIPDYSLTQLSQRWFSVSCDTMDNPIVFNFTIKEGNCNGNTVSISSPFNKNNNVFGVKLFTVKITLSGNYGDCVVSKTLYYPVFAENYLDGDLLKAVEENEKIRNLIAERVKYIVCDQLRAYIPNVS